MEERKRESRQEHPELLRLDAVRAGEGTAEEKSHVEGCGLCRGEMDHLHTLETSLRAQVPPAEHVPSRVNDTILGEYRRRTAPAGGTVVFPARRRWLVPAMGSAAAAALVFALSFQQARNGKFSTEDLRTPEEVQPGRVLTEQQTSPGDVNGDGAVDILDAFRLAKLIEDRDPGAAGPDINGDGEVNRLDVDAVARRAVAL